MSYDDKVRRLVKDANLYPDTQPEATLALIPPLTLKTEGGRFVKVIQVGWLGPYGLIPGGMTVDPVPSWLPVFAAEPQP